MPPGPADENPEIIRQPEAEAILRLDGRGLTPGTWRAEFWDTWSDAAPTSTEFTIAADGTGSVMLPPLVRDCGMKLILVP